MNYEIKPTHLFLNQIETLSKKALTILEEKILFLKINPARFKQIEGYPYNLFRIRFVDSGKSKRLVYAIDEKYVKLLCVIDRSKNYKELKKYVEMIKKDKEL